MRYGFMQRAMWTAFQKSFKEAIHTVLDETDADGVMQCAKKKYREMLNDVKTIRIYYKTAMDNKIMRISAASTSKRYYTEKGRAKMKAFAEKSQSITNPYDWKFTVEDGETIHQYTATFYTCGICTLMNRLGLFEYIPAMCAFDYDMAAMSNTKFTREFTLAGGGPYCDCHYNHKT